MQIEEVIFPCGDDVRFILDQHAWFTF